MTKPTTTATVGESSNLANQHPDLFDDIKAAAYIGVSPSFLRRRRCYTQGIIATAGPPYIKLGRKVLYRKQDLDNFLASSRIQGGESHHKSEFAVRL